MATDYTRDEVIQIIEEKSGRTLTPNGFYFWIPYCQLEGPKPLYWEGDLERFIFIANALNRVRNIEVAASLLATEMDRNPSPYEVVAPKPMAINQRRRRGSAGTLAAAIGG